MFDPQKMYFSTLKTSAMSELLRIMQPYVQQRYDKSYFMFTLVMCIFLWKVQFTF